MLDVVRQAWREQVEEEVLEPDLPVVDAHHHFFPVAHRDHLEPCAPEEFLTEIRLSGHFVVSTIHVDAFANYRNSGPAHLRVVGETENIQQQVLRDLEGTVHPGACAAIVGHADLMMGRSVGEVLDAHLAASTRFKGVRRMTIYDPDLPAGLPGHQLPGLLRRSEFHEGMKEVSARGLSFDASVVQSQLTELVGFANAFPGTTIILGHIGTPLGVGRYLNRVETAFAEWYSGMQALSRCPNVVVKIGGLNMPFTGLGVDSKADKPLTSVQMAERQRRHVLSTIDLFGPNRCMFESNFPVDRWFTSYRVLWNAFKLMTRDFTVNERDLMFRSTASRVYRIYEGS